MRVEEEGRRRVTKTERKHKKRKLNSGDGREEEWVKEKARIEEHELKSSQRAKKNRTSYRLLVWTLFYPFLLSTFFSWHQEQKA